MLGSVTEHVLRRAPCPVMTVSPAAEGRPSARYGTVLCPIDFSPTSERTLHAAAAVAEEAQARLVVLHVVEGSTYPPFRMPPGFDVATYRQEVESELSGRLWRLMPLGLGPAEVAVAWGVPHHEIVRQAKQRQAGLIVMGAHGGALDSTLFGSTSHRVVRRATCPVLVLRARAHAFEETAPEPLDAVGVAD
jgi:nucleotide-binding universal stress UspA family protein